MHLVFECVGEGARSFSCSLRFWWCLVVVELLCLVHRILEQRPMHEVLYWKIRLAILNHLPVFVCPVNSVYSECDFATWAQQPIMHGSKRTAVVVVTPRISLCVVFISLQAHMAKCANVPDVQKRDFA